MASWRVLAGSGGALATVATKTRSGFETAFRVSGSYATFSVQALDARGRVLGSSADFRGG